MVSGSGKISLGQFVKNRVDDLGIGKVVETRKFEIVVEYFDSPSTEMYYQVYQKDDIDLAELDYQMRVYFYDDSCYNWKAGRFLTAQNKLVHILLPNKEGIILPENKVFVRWNKPVSDPTFLLENEITETPFFHEKRAPLIKNIIHQRKYSGGMSGLLSSSIELEKYQVEVIRRVLSDPIQRYLLADEVGLGKTIEAGVIVRQHVLDNPRSHKIIIVVPRHLVYQWQKELTEKFHLKNYLDNTLYILQCGDLNNLQNLNSDVTMTVIDEAHHIEGFGDINQEYLNEIKTLAQQSEKLLLLSATPALYNEKSFLMMLSLLDPDNYSTDDLATFRDKIEKRQLLADSFYVLTEEKSNYFLRNPVKVLKELLPTDEYLQELLENLGGLLNAISDGEKERRNELIRSVRTHINETYRLHRRMLRNRRTENDDPFSPSGVCPGRDGITIVEYDYPLLLELERLLERWRSNALLHCSGSEEQKRYSHLFMKLLTSYFSGPDSLKRDVIARLNSQTQRTTAVSKVSESLKTVPLFADEKDILGDVLQVLEVLASDKDEKLVALMDEMEEIMDNHKVVIFCDTAQKANYIYHELSGIYSNCIVRHQTETAEVDSSQKPEWYRFLSDDKCRVIVVDKIGEEGLNLQGTGGIIIHYDMPLSPNRIEQRIGRLDRFGTGGCVSSVVLLFKDSLYYANWIKYLNEAFGVFDHSIATLQYVIDTEIKYLSDEIIIHGSEIFSDRIRLLAGEKGLIRNELKKLQSQDALDSIEVNQMFDREWIGNFELEDKDTENIQVQMEGWIVETLNFTRLRERRIPEILSYRYEDNTLMPISFLQDKFIDAVDLENSNRWRTELKSYKMTYKRLKAVRNKTHVARLGEPFMSAMEKYINWDDRGMCFALWRTYSLHKKTELFFCFDFIVEANILDTVRKISALRNVNEKEIVDSIRRRGDMFFPPFTERIWLNGDLELVTDKTMLYILGLPYYKGTDKTYRDYNLNTSRWEKIRELKIDESWKNTCREAKIKALELLSKCGQFQSNKEKYLKRAEIQIQIILSQLRSRYNSHNINYETESVLLNSILEGIKNPNIKIDSAGGLYLSNKNPFTEKEIEEADV